MALPLSKAIKSSEEAQSKNGVGATTATRGDQQGSAGLPKSNGITVAKAIGAPQQDLHTDVPPPAQQETNLGLPNLPNETATLENQANNSQPSLGAESNPGVPDSPNEPEPSLEIDNNPTGSATAPSDDDGNTAISISGLSNPNITVPVGGNEENSENQNTSDIASGVLDYQENGGINSQRSSLNNPSRRRCDPPTTSTGDRNSTTKAPSNKTLVQEKHPVPRPHIPEGAVGGQDPLDSSQPQDHVSISTKRSQGSNPSTLQQGPSSPSGKKKKRKNQKRRNKNKRNKKPSTRDEETSNDPPDNDPSRTQEADIRSTSQSSPEESPVGSQLHQDTDGVSLQHSDAKTNSRRETTRDGYSGSATSLNASLQTRRIFPPNAPPPPPVNVNQSVDPIQVASVLQERRETPLLDVHAPIQLATPGSVINLIQVPATDQEPETVRISMIHPCMMVIYSEAHPNKTLEKLNYQRISAEFTDITVSVAGRHFTLHKSLLAAHSSLFCSVLQDATIGQVPAPNVNLDGVELEYFSIIIDFIYTSKLNVTSANIEQLQTTAQFLQIQDVIDLCNQFKKHQKEALARQYAVRSKKVDYFIKRPTDEPKSAPSEKGLKENPHEPIKTGKELSGEKSVQQKQNSKMMVEVYGSKEGSFASDDGKPSPALDDADGLQLVMEDIAEESKAKKRGRKPQARVVCQVCNKSFTRPKYEVHKRTHTGEKPFTCTICNKQFVSIYNLTIHERTHTGERPYHCKLCGKTFSDPSTIRKHVLWHAGVKNKQCDLCGKYFSTMTQVREHQRSHTKEKPYACPECGKAYGYRCDLKRHMREHTGDLFGPCGECRKYFNHKGNFLSHLKSHTRKTTTTPPQLKLQDSGLMTSDGRVILKAKLCDGMLVLPTQDGTSNANHSTDVTMQEALPDDQSGSSQHQDQKLSASVEDNEIEVTLNDGKLFVKHANGPQIIPVLKDEGLSATTSSDDQGQIFEQECETTLSADQVIMLVQHAQGLEMTPASIEEVKVDGTPGDDIILSNDDETLVVVDGTIH